MSYRHETRYSRLANWEGIKKVSLLQCCVLFDLVLVVFWNFELFLLNFEILFLFLQNLYVLRTALLLCLIAKL